MDVEGEVTPLPHRRTSPPGVVWPLVLHGAAATMEVLQAQFRVTERSAPEVIRAQQMQQIESLAAHAHAHSAFWRDRLAAAGFGRDPQWFTRLPVLTRGQVKDADSAVYALPVPAEHGGTHELRTSGSTGTPMLIMKTDLALQFWKAVTLRDSLWHNRDLSGKLAVVRVGSAPGYGPNWGEAYEGYDTGPCVTFDARTDVDAQLDWLDAEQPVVLLTHASNLRALAVRSVERSVRLPGLREAR